MAILLAAAGEIPNWFAVSMGIGTVFVGLIAIIIICKIVGLFCREKTVAAAPIADERPDEKTVAAICAACAEDMGTDVKNLRVISIKRI